ncbi:GNAT family N-acetyltransferase [Occultella gossypii]|uniref:GNAT family N-acetyltransferase n=1 Tax=Occultella gossypii TaxID=2800820 RepID=A0ABS7S490_9MICO|nr:GNAT family N-acetyltransferase [Occultella gossypii]MBZ2195169.1 GNAT family N-acetyltransferase [Occultella gossypii]
MTPPEALRPRSVTDLPAPWPADRFIVDDFDRWADPLAWGDERALLFLARPRPDTAALIGVGEPAALAAVLAAVITPDGGPSVAESGHLGQVAVASLTRGTWDLLDTTVAGVLGLPTVSHWDWLWTEAPPPATPGEDAVRLLDPVADAEEILAVQAAANPTTHLTLDREGARWFGWRDGQGSLRAIGGTTQRPVSVHLGSIATVPAWRGRGLGAAVTAAMTRGGISSTGQVSLGMYADNAPARRLYTRLGFAVGQEVETHRRA